MFKLSLFILLFTCHQLYAQTAPGSAERPPVATGADRDTVPAWVRAIPLQPNENVYFKKGKTLDHVYFSASIMLQAAVTKAVLTGKRNVIRKASRSFVKGIADSLHLKKGTKLTVGTGYFDRCRGNAGVSRRLVYLINGRKIKLYTDSTFDETARLDSAVSSRLDSFYLAPDEYIVYLKEEKAFLLCKITAQCHKDEPLPNEPEFSWASKTATRLLFEVVRRDFPKFKSVGCGCTDPWSNHYAGTSALTLDKFDLEHNYESDYQHYKRGEAIPSPKK